MLRSQALPFEHVSKVHRISLEGVLQRGILELRCRRFPV
jgi:hypothetical protein